MDQRLSLVTLGVGDLARARRFYEALGWTTGAAPADDVVFFQTGGMIVALWGRGQLAGDSGGGGGGGGGGGAPPVHHPSPWGGGPRHGRGPPGAGGGTPRG